MSLGKGGDLCLGEKVRLRGETRVQCSMRMLRGSVPLGGVAPRCIGLFSLVGVSPRLSQVRAWST